MRSLLGSDYSIIILHCYTWNVVVDSLIDFPADVSDPGAIIQYANAQKEDKTHDGTKPKEQVMSFDLSMLPVEGGIDDPMFLDTSQQTMEARQLMQTLQNENSGLENDVTSLGNKEQAISKKNSKPRMDDEASDVIVYIVYYCIQRWLYRNVLYYL